METCLLKNKKICSFDIFDKNGKKNYENEVIWKMASQKMLLVCDECKEVVFFKSGEKKNPHFSHRPNSLKICSKVNSKQTEEYLIHKKKIYNLLRNIPEVFNIEVDYMNKSDFFIDILGETIKISLKKIESIILNDYLTDDFIFFYGNEKYMQNNTSLKKIFYINENFIKIYDKSNIKNEIPLNFVNLRNLYLDYIILNSHDNKIKILLNDINLIPKISNLSYSDKIKLQSNILKNWKRNSSLKDIIIFLNNNKCEFNDNHLTFISKKTNKNFVEGHHLIPLNSQKFFNVTLDRVSNIVSLCPNCHRMIHHGTENEKIKIIITLYNKRKIWLRDSGINITLNFLKNIYDFHN